MNTLVVCRFGDPVGAERVLPPLRALAQDGELVIGDAALVSWPRTARKPSTETLGTLTGPGELWGGSWGVLLGLIFLVPIAGPAFGAAAGAFAGTLADCHVAGDQVVPHGAVRPERRGGSRPARRGARRPRPAGHALGDRARAGAAAARHTRRGISPIGLKLRQ